MKVILLRVILKTCIMLLVILKTDFMVNITLFCVCVICSTTECNRAFGVIQLSAYQMCVVAPFLWLTQ